MKNPSGPSDQKGALPGGLFGPDEQPAQSSNLPELEARLDLLERFRALLDHSTDVILLIHLSSKRIVDANASACRQLGYVCADLRSMSVDDVVELGRLMWPEEGSCPSELERVATVLRRKDRSEIPVEISFSMDDFGGSAYLVAVARDISDRFQAEQELKRHQILLSSVLNNTDNAILALDADRRVIYYNDQYLQLYPFGREYMDACPTVENLIRRACEMGLYPPEQANELIIRRLQHLEGTAQNNVIETPRLDGILLEGFATKLPEGGYLLTFRDITERKRAEEALRESEERFRSIFEASATGMVVLSLKGEFLQVNPAFCHFLGYAETELTKLTVMDVTHPEDLDATCRSLEEAWAGRLHKFDLEKRYVRKDGSVVWGMVTATWVLDSKKKPLYSVALIQDITARKRVEEVLRESDRMKTEFISTAAHELRTPLTSIQGFSQVLLTQDNISPEERKEFLTYIHERAAALAHIMADLLDIARIESGQGLSLHKGACTVRELLRQLEPLMQTGGGAHHFEQDLLEEQTRLNVDKGKMGQVLENLLSNAIKYSPVGGLIRLRGEVVAGQCQISVSDQGIGMTPEQVAKVFDKFYRADASNTALEGIGLGMSIVKNIVEAHGGRIWVESALGEGTTVSFTIPLGAA